MGESTRSPEDAARTDDVTLSARVGLMIAMRDGVRLATDVLWPPEGPDGGPYPAVIARTPYGKQRKQVPLPPSASHMRYSIPEGLRRAGYVVVVQDCRGRHDSEGDWYPNFHEETDGYDTVEWVASQPWCTSAVGMIGGSYEAWTQWAAARRRPPHLRALASLVCCMLWTGEWPWWNGVMVGVPWTHLVGGRVQQDNAHTTWQSVVSSYPPLSNISKAYGRELPVAEHWLAHPAPDDYWAPITLTADDFARIDTPVLHMTGWWDGCLRSSNHLYQQMRRHSPAAADQVLVVGPWDHATSLPQRIYSGIDFGPDATIDVAALHVAWFDRWLRGDGSPSSQQATTAATFVTGVNRWTVASSFPPPDVVERPWFVSPEVADVQADGRLVDEAPTGPEAPTTYRYDPNDPVDVNAFGPEERSTYPHLDQTAMHQRPDVVTYVTEPLENALALRGSPVARLYASSDRPDTDWILHIADVSPDGSRFLVSYGVLRARFHDEDNMVEELLEPGRVYEFRLTLNPRAHVFDRGHRICLAITSSAFPLLARNPNCGGPIATESVRLVANNSIHHSARHPSRVVLPVTAVPDFTDRRRIEAMVAASPDEDGGRRR